MILSSEILITHSMYHAVPESRSSLDNKFYRRNMQHSTNQRAIRDGVVNMNRARKKQMTLVGLRLLKIILTHTTD